VLSRDIAARASTRRSTSLDFDLAHASYPLIVGDEHMRWRARLAEILALYKALRTSSAILCMDVTLRRDK